MPTECAHSCWLSTQIQHPTFRLSDSSVPVLQDLTPPKDSNVRVMVLQDHGSIALSHSACVPLVKGSVHSLKCSEAEHLVRMGVLQVLDPNC